MIESQNDVNSTLALIAEKMNDFCVAHKKSNIDNIKIIQSFLLTKIKSSQIIDLHFMKTCDSFVDWIIEIIFQHFQHKIHNL